MKLTLHLSDEEELLLRRVFPHYFMPQHRARVKDDVEAVLRELQQAGVEAFRRNTAIGFPVECRLATRERRR